MGKRGFQPRDKSERLFALIAVDRSAGCWVWQGSKNQLGYGHIHAEAGRWTGAHRFAYEVLVEPIPDGLVIDHLCRNPSCVNPAHLQPVTPLENNRRGKTNGSKTHCPHGHAYSPENTAVVNGAERTYRTCKTCRREQHRQRRQRLREAKERLR